MDQGALARTAGADDSQHFSTTHLQIDIVQNFMALLPVGGIGEADLLEANAARELSQTLGAWFLTDVVFEIHELEDFGGGAQSLLKVVIKQCELADRIVETEDSRDKGDKNPGRHLIVRDPVAAN